MEKDYKNQGNNLCEACQEHIDNGEAIRHHTSYYPEETVLVHQSCHIEIHRSDKHLHLRPAKDEKDRYYKKGKYAKKDEKLPEEKTILKGFSYFYRNHMLSKRRRGNSF